MPDKSYTQPNLSKQQEFHDSLQGLKGKKGKVDPVLN
jgi:hypothetical protein